MEIRPVRPPDLDRLIDIDGTIESSDYLHVERSGEGFTGGWKIEQRALREKRMDRNAPTDETLFLLRQIVNGADEGFALLANHDGINLALLVAKLEPDFRTLHVLDLRVDFEQRRQGLGSAMLFQTIAHAREQELRAVATETRTDNFPAAQFLTKSGFELAGLDSRRLTNHDLVKEAVTLFWYASFD
ncbi:MAG TPA: GNAT family N-acetyltransferase [Tepidisphaeraceae bacterium]|nr:GNAT family N-acetyltransferase [Tepidisphaeraceae bacterium]